MILAAFVALGFVLMLAAPMFLGVWWLFHEEGQR